ALLVSIPDKTDYLDLKETRFPIASSLYYMARHSGHIHSWLPWHFSFLVVLHGTALRPYTFLASLAFQLPLSFLIVSLDYRPKPRSFQAE
ncbi:hypothetical protein, partial [Oleiphilus sp. HI0061]|uniref:hypothetical protein n=1 Tax=Oleiphilus sp. HI0061 TaxID=1822239 RepID=UPI001E3C6A04